MDGVNTSTKMQGKMYKNTTITRNKPLRSWVMPALVVTLFACMLLCITAVIAVTYCLNSIDELRTQQRAITEHAGQLQRRLTHVESRCKHITDSGGFPLDSVETTNDDAIREFPESSDTDSSGLPVKDQLRHSAPTNPLQRAAVSAVPAEPTRRPWPFNVHKRAAGGGCKKCRDGAQGQRGDRGRRGQKGDRGERGQRGERGPPGECVCPSVTLPPVADVGTTNTKSPQPTGTQATPTLPIPTTTAPPQFSGLPVAHFEGDITSAVSANVEFDRFNPEFGTVIGGWIPHWRAAEWMTSDLHDKFHLHTHSGNVTVRDAGVYYVYSQMLYHDAQGNAMGHSLYINNTKTLTCAQSTSDPDDIRNLKTCHIAGLVKIPKGYHVGIKLTFNDRIISFARDKTFWGIIKMF